MPVDHETYIRGGIGATGPAGPASTVPGPAGANGTPVWKGAWDSGTTYVSGDAVAHADASYVSKSTQTNHEPPDATYWDVLCIGGASITASATPPATPATGDLWIDTT